jgi:hypothetical protein
MSFIVDSIKFRAWCAKASTANTTYHVKRTELYNQLTALIEEGKEAKTPFTLPLSSFHKLKGYLTSRSQKLQDNDAITLSFTKTLEELVACCMSDADAEDDDILPNTPVKGEVKKDEEPKKSP